MDLRAPDTLTFVFYRAPGNWRDRAIRIFSGSEYSHCEFLLDGPTPTYRYALCVSASKRDGHRVRAKPIQMHTGHWGYLTIPGDYQRARKWSLDHVERRTPYNTMSAALSITGWPHKSGRGMHCSEFCALAANAGGAQIERPHMLTPGELYEQMEAHGAQKLTMEESHEHASSQLA